MTNCLTWPHHYDLAKAHPTGHSDNTCHIVVHGRETTSLLSRFVADRTRLSDLLARADPDAPALIDDVTELTFGALAGRAGLFAGWLRAQLPPDAAVGILAENSVDYVAWLYAIPAAGMRAVLLNVRDHPDGWAQIVARTNIRLVVGDAALLDRLNEGVELADFDDALARATAAADTDMAPPADDPIAAAEAADAVAWIVPTSGTTGTPKLAMLSHATLLAAVRGCAEARPVAPDDVYLLAFPLCHVAAYNVLVQHLHARPVVVTRRFDPARTAALIERHRVTVASLAPTMIAAIVDDATLADRHDLRTLRLIGYGSAPIAEPLLRRAMGALGCGFSQGYGMTELSGNCVFLDDVDHARGLDGDPALLRSAGRATTAVEIRILDDEGKNLALGAVGEIAVRGAQVMVGYHDDPTATAEAIVGGWLRTGDLGRLDERGYLTVVDRKKDVIVTGGENVASREVESVLHAHVSVRDAAVIGVPDERWGERVTAVVTAAPGHTIDEPTLVQHCRDHLAGFKIPRRVVELAELPRNATGKVDKPRLRRDLAPHAPIRA